MNREGLERVDGSVNIQASIHDPSQAITSLPETIVEITALYNTQSGGQKNGQFNSLTQQSLDPIPYEPEELSPAPSLTLDLTPQQSKKPSTSWSLMVQRLQLPGFDSTAHLAST